ncbi:MAG: tRNA (adenosine(37)-N6)-threonylcarbamoyltransferase complex ATPase subunit type 1 TsaE [Candidatus Marinamargulisbacteria bacterium]
MGTKYTSTITVASIDDLDIVSMALIPHLTAPFIIGLNGAMGSGKTTFVRQFSAVLGSNDWVNSPTYAIIQRYQAPPLNLLHIDLYRTTSDYEIDQLAIPSLVQDNTIVLMEWADKASDIIQDITLDFTIMNESTRQITVSSNNHDWVGQLNNTNTH